MVSIFHLHLLIIVSYSLYFLALLEMNLTIFSFHIFWRNQRALIAGADIKSVHYLGVNHYNLANKLMKPSFIYVLHGANTSFIWRLIPIFFRWCWIKTWVRPGQKSNSVTLLKSNTIPGKRGRGTDSDSGMPTRIRSFFFGAGSAICLRFGSRPVIFLAAPFTLI